MQDLSFLEDFITTLAEPYKDILNITVGTDIFTFYDQFNNRYKGRLLKYHSREDFQKSTKIEIALIFEDSKWELEKIKKEAELLGILTDLTNWADKNDNLALKYGETNNKVDNNQVSFMSSSYEDKNKTTIVSSDNNSYTDKQLEEGEDKQLPEENLKDVIDYSLPLNQYQKNLTDDLNKTDSLGSLNIKRGEAGDYIELNKNKTEASNVSEDVKHFLNLVLPKLRHDFLNRFRPLFLWTPY